MNSDIQDQMQTVLMLERDQAVLNGNVRIGLAKFEENVKRKHDGFLEDFTVVLKDLKTLAKVTQVVDGILS